jgi:5-methylcytosine-specific restriction endonuclease McrA
MNWGAVSHRMGSGRMTFKTRTCQRCGREYQPTSSTQKYCTDCHPLVEATQIRARVAKYRRENREKVNQRHAKYRRENVEKVKQALAKWARENPEKRRASKALRFSANPEKHRASDAKWRKANVEKIAVWASKRRAAKYANTPLNEMLTSTEWLAILAEANGHCHYCGREAKLTLDHVIPLSKGGKHSKDNVVPACLHCNESKKDKTLREWMTRRVLDTKKISV